MKQNPPVDDHRSSGDPRNRLVQFHATVTCTKIDSRALSGEGPMGAYCAVAT